MTKDRPTRLYWIGEYDAHGQPLEYFGATPGEHDGIPARDLTPDDTAHLTEAQWAAIESDTGKRLYQKTEPKHRAPDTTPTTSPSAVEPSSTDVASTGATN